MTDNLKCKSTGPCYDMDDRKHHFECGFCSELFCLDCMKIHIEGIK